MQRTATSISRLMQIKDVSKEDAERIRWIWHNVQGRRHARDQIDAILRTFGVEFLGVHKRSKEDVYYCNAGDTYATTVMFIGPRLIVGCWGDLVEANAVRDSANYY